MAAFVYLATPRGLLGLLVLVLFSFGPPDGVYCADAPYTNPSGLLIARGTRHKKTAQKAVYIGDPTGIARTFSLVLFSFGPPDGVYCADAPYTNPSGLLIARGTRHKKTAQKAVYIGDPTGIRTPVTAVKGRCPRPLDDGVI